MNNVKTGYRKSIINWEISFIYLIPGDIPIICQRDNLQRFIERWIWTTCQVFQTDLIKNRL